MQTAAGQQHDTPSDPDVSGGAGRKGQSGPHQLHRKNNTSSGNMGGCGGLRVSHGEL